MEEVMHDDWVPTSDFPIHRALGFAEKKKNSSFSSNLCRIAGVVSNPPSYNINWFFKTLKVGIKQVSLYMCRKTFNCKFSFFLKFVYPSENNLIIQK